MKMKRNGASEVSPLEVCVKLPVRAIRLVLAAAVGGLFFAHLLTQYLVHYSSLDSSLFRMIATGFDLNAESNLPTWYSSSSLLVCALLFLVVGLSERRRRAPFRLHWFGLALIALAFSADEIACLHEKLNDPVRSLLGVGGYFRFAWVIPGLVFLTLALISYRRFHHSLPGLTRRKFGLAVGVYFIGSLGFEMIGGKWSEQYGRSGFGYGALTGVEELLEMLGVLLLIDCLALHIRTHVGWAAKPIVRREAGRSRVVSASRRVTSAGSL